jgi:hypothetical protein
MASKAKAKPAAKAKPKAKSTSRKRSSRKSTAKKTATQFPQAFVSNSRFAPGTKVGFWPAADVGIERQQGQAPFPKATKTATVAKDGTLQVSGLPLGEYVAAAETGEDGRWTYVLFTVKADG